jgi:hypothetical protein
VSVTKTGVTAAVLPRVLSLPISLPFPFYKQYVDGNTKWARAFNCVQRSHQQAFETLPQFLFFTFAASLVFPISSAVHVLLWLFGRLVWSNGYATSGGDAEKRYEHPLAFMIFSSLMGQFFLSMAAGGEILGLWSMLRGFAGF